MSRIEVTKTQLEGVLLIKTNVYRDSRGCFAETFVQPRYEKLGLNLPFVQDNCSHSQKDVVRGLHIQPHYPQGKLITVSHGHIWDVVVDINPQSSTFGEYAAFDLYGFDQADEHQDGDATAHNALQQLWIPPRYAHGFCVLSDSASVYYKCTELYHPEDEMGIIWNDADLNIPWPIANAIVSKRDEQLPTLQQWVQQFLG